MRIKPITIMCASPAAAKALQEEYEYIGRRTRREGNAVIVKTTTL